MRIFALATIVLISTSCGSSGSGPDPVGPTPAPTPEPTPERPTITVNPGDSIQDAVDAADAGSRIEVNPGTYMAMHGGAASVLVEKSLHLIANVVDGETAIIVPGPGNTEGILAQGTPEEFIEDIVIRGFDIQGFSENGIWTKYVDGFEIADNNVGDSDHVGIYPQLSANGLVRDNVAFGGSDSALWVSGAEDIRVINNTVHTSPTGLQVSVSQRIEAVNNTSYNNVVGIGLYHPLSSGIPDPSNGLGFGGPVGQVLDNDVYDNNLPNPVSGGLVGQLPTGLGILMAGADGANVENNSIRDNLFAGLVLIDWCLATGDTDPDCTPDGNRIVGNTITGNGGDPPEHPFDALASDVIVLGQGEGNCMSDNTYGTSTTGDAIASITQDSCPPLKQ